MDDNKLISCVGDFGVYQIVLLVCSCVLNISVYFPIYFLTFMETPPYVNYKNLASNQTEVILFNQKLCDQNFTINGILTKTNYYFEKNNSFTQNFPYCSDYTMTSLQFYYSLLSYFYVFVNLLFPPKRNYVISYLGFYLVLILFSIFYYTFSNSLENFVTYLMIPFMVLQIFTSNILVSSVHYLSGITTKLHRRKFIYLSVVIPSNVALILASFIFNTNMQKEDFYVFIHIFSGFSLIFGIAFLLISTEIPKYLKSTETEQIQQIIIYICKVNNIFKSKTIQKEKLESLRLDDVGREASPRNVYYYNEPLLRTPKLLLFMFLYFLTGFIFNITSIQIKDFSYNIDSYWYLILSANLILCVILSFTLKKEFNYFPVGIIFVLLTSVKFLFKRA